MPGRSEEPSVSRSHPEHIFKGLTEDPLARAIAEQRAATVHVDGDLENFGRWPKRKKAVTQPTSAPFQELAEEFRRLAAEARTCIDDTHPWEAEPASRAWAERAETWDEAAKMLEEKLNG